jgi:hypothetical protein
MSLYLILSALPAGLLFLAMLSIVYVSWRNGISPMPASGPVRRAVADELKRLPGCGAIVEAGSGWGTLALHIALHCPGKRIEGIENSPVPLWVSRFAAWITAAAARTQITFTGGDMYDYPYETVDVVVCYLYPGAMKRLSVILDSRLRPGATIITVCFALPDWQPDQVVTCGDMYRTKLYLYKA